MLSYNKEGFTYGESRRSQSGEIQIDVEELK